MTVFRSRTTPLARIVSAVLAAAAAAPAAMAQDAATTTGGLEEVLVTATRAGITNLQQTPVSVSAVTAEDIDRMVARDISGIASSVPGFSASRITAFNAASFAMRGVGLTDIIVYQDAPVGVTMDDFVLPSVQTQLLDTFDIESVEVLRGPQGTLFGKNTTGGAVNIRSKRPDMDELGADFRLGYGSFNAVRAQGSVDVPIIDDVLALRFVGAYSKSDGYYKLGANWGPVNTISVFPGQPIHPFTIPGVTGESGEGSPNKSIGGDDNLNGRIKAQWNVNDDLTFLAQYEIMRDRSDAVPSYNDTPPDGPYLWNVLGFSRPKGDPLDNMASTQRHDSLLKMDEGQVIDVDGIYLNMEWDVGVGTIYANAGKRSQDEHLPNTYTGAAPINSVTGEVISLFDATRDTTRDTTQFEARFASDFDGSLNFVAGVFQQTNDAAFCVVQVLGFIDLAFDLGAFDLPQQANNSTPQVLCNKQDSDSLAGYFDATWEVTDQFSLAGGYRMTRDERSWAGRTQVSFDTLDDNNGLNGSLSWQDFSDPMQAGNFSKYPGGIIVNQNTPGFENLSETWTEPSWRIVGSYKFTDKLFGYATISEGYKAGGYNDQTGTSGLMVSELTRPVDPEFATNYEVGMKWESEDSRFRFNPTVFFTTYKDAQRAVNIITANEQGATFQETVFYNAAEVEAKGIELEFQAALTDNFRIRAQASYLDAKYNEFVINQPEITDPVTGATIQEFNEDFSGLPVPRSPEFMGSIQGVYTWELASGSRVEFGAEFYHEDENLFYISAAGRDYDAYLDEKNLINASVTYTDPDANWFVRGYGKNLTDERYRIASQSVATLWTHSQFGAPINFGVEFGMGFGGSR